MNNSWLRFFFQPVSLLGRTQFLNPVRVTPSLQLDIFQQLKVPMQYLLPLHILSYGYTFGATTFESFVASPIALKSLPRRQFGELQASTLPVHLATQAIGPIIIAATAPYALSTVGISLLAVSSLGGIFNIAYVSPLCADLKSRRWKIIDTKFGGDDKAAVASGELKAIDAEFGKWHGVSMLSNVLSVITVTAYGFVLSGKLRV